MEVPLLGELATAQQVFLLIGGCIFLALGAQAWILLHLFTQNGRMLQRFEALERGLETAATRRDRGPRIDRRDTAPSVPDNRLHAAHDLRVGDVAPGLQLDDLTGVNRSLDDFRGSETLILFWDPGCDFCKRMLEELKAWESAHQDDSPKLLVVSRGTSATNTKMELHAPVVLDPGGHASSRYGATATPSAVLIDADGKIAAPLVRGIRACNAVLNSFAPPANGGEVGSLHSSVSL